MDTFITFFIGFASGVVLAFACEILHIKECQKNGWPLW